MLKSVGIGKTGDGGDVTGSINIPEVAHDTEEDEYVVSFLPLLAPWHDLAFPPGGRRGC